ncbi:DUF1488 domain-containing protein [Phyllobacterium lublinensis]|uniref:DUF1488 domain-containing protein n=1 Tax=Phyllobacterium lublinensis TaxID=2875708 RepID=UPI001CCAA67A|nr:DUF1488 domain-containing protein [Phyllobacterium sp. 2063]MBZ9656315.1 DUF1488 domain-containing protein [Phyllobacterium sp. 2063]
MTLTFPNRSRSYDTAHQRVRFLGYDGLFEVPFFIEAAAVPSTNSNPHTAEEDCLAAFDAERGTIIEVARQVYAYGRKTMYVLTPADFKRGN